MRKIAFAAVGTALALSLVACNGNSTAGSSQGGGNGNQSGGLSIMGNVSALADQVNKGTADSSSAKVTFDGSVSGQTLTGSGMYRTKPDVAMDMAVKSPEGDVRIVFVDETLYLQVPQQEQAAMGGKPWIKISANGTDPLSKTIGPALKSMTDNVDVTKQVQQMKDAGTITKSQQETLNGQQVVHYWIDVDVAKLAALQKDEFTRKALEQVQQQGVTKLAEELWVANDGLPAKLATAVPMGAGKSGKITMTFTDWGKPVTVQAPPANQVGELPKLGG